MDDAERKKPQQISLLTKIMLFIIALTVIAALIVPNYLHEHANPSSFCISSLKNISTSLEMYSTDAGGRYPLRLSDICPRYMRIMPTCPAANKQTYEYVRSEHPDLFTVYCKGKYHIGSKRESYPKENYPQYDSIQGLIEY